MFINPAIGEQSTISYTLNLPANITIDLYKAYLTLGTQGDGIYHRELAMRLVDNQPRMARCKRRGQAGLAADRRITGRRLCD